MRDIISNDTLTQIAKTVDEILDRMDSNTKRIEMPENIIDGDKVLFNYRQYDGVLYQVKVNDVNIIISDYTLDDFLSNVHMRLKISKNKYVYVNIADKGFRMYGGSIEERTPTDYDVWIPDPYEFTNNGYSGRFTRDYYVPGEHTNIQYVQYLLVGLTVGEEYTFTFKSKIALHHSGTSVEWRGKPYGLLFAYDSTIDHEVVDVLPHDSGVWHSDVNFQSFYRDEEEHTYTCTITPEYSYMNITFIFDGVNSFDGYKSFTWSRFKSNKGVNILDKEICFEGTWYSLGANGGTSDLDAIELTYAEYQALPSAEKTDPDKIYFITDYPGGSGVVINPTGTATDTAETIEVDGTIYDFMDADAVHTADIGVAGGVAELDSNGKVPSAQLPSYVDDVVEYASISAFPATGESGKIYIALDTNKTYRWTGSVYVEISPSLALGETSSTAYRGDRGKTAYDHSQSDHSGIAPAFTEASTRANIASGETFATLLGKIKKFFSDLKAVAFSGSYNDLSDQPTIPTVNNATLTIQKNGTTVETFTANASSNKTANITVPTKVSELTNDSGYTTNTGTVTQVKVGSTAYNPSSGVVSLPAYPTSLPASDVSAWAKASTKPSYNFGEIGAGVATIGDGGNYVQLRSGGGAWNSGFYYQTTGDEAFVFGVKNSRTSFIFANTDPAERTVWTSLSPAMQIKDNKVAINKLIANSAYLTYPLEVNGDVQATNFRGNLVGNADTATTATKLGSSTVGGTTTPIYLNAGTPTALSYTIAKNVPSDAVFTDTKVTQTATTTNSSYEVLFSYTADNTDRTEGARKCSKIKANPSTGILYSKGMAVDNGQVTTVYGVGTITHNNKAISLPSSAGTLALTSQIPSAPHTVREYTGTITGDVVRVTHNLGLGTSYKPIVSWNSSVAIVLYGMRNITTNYFELMFASINGYVLGTATGVSVTIRWTY